MKRLAILSVLSLVVALGLLTSASASTDAKQKGARLVGTWNVSGVAVAGAGAELVGVAAGTTVERTWSFKPTCSKGACDTVLTRKQADGTSATTTIEYLGGGRYSWGDTLPTLKTRTCNQPEQELDAWAGQGEFTLRVTKTQKKRGVLVAAAFTATGSFKYATLPDWPAASGCAAATAQYSFNYSGTPR